MSKKLIEIASEIVQAQVGQMPMAAQDIVSSLRQVFSMLQGLKKAEVEGTEIALTAPATEEAVPQSKPAITPENSIQNDKVICLECGSEMKQLSQKHLSLHGMTSKEYRKKYKIAMKTPLSAKSVTKARSKAAKKRGLPEKLKQYLADRKQSKAAASVPTKIDKPVVEQSRKVIRRPGARKKKG